MDVNYFGIRGVGETLRFGKGGPLLDTSDHEGFVAKSADGLTLVTIQGATGTGPNDYVTYAQLQSHVGGGASGPVEWADIENRPQAFPSTISLVDGLQTALDAKASVTHAHSLATGEAAGFMAPAMVLKLADIQSGATANSPDATLLSRANHTGTQAISTVTGLQDALDGKASSGHGHGTATTSVAGFMSAADKTKLNGIAVGATTNLPDASLLDRANHTGSQAISTVIGLQDALDDKAEDGHTHGNATGSVAGFMTAAHYTKLEGIANGATTNLPDASLLNRANHTGSQEISTVTGLQTALNGKAAATHVHATATTSVDGFMSAADKTKLDGVAAQATKNDTDANLKNRANHTGSQAISTVTGLQTALDGKFDTTGGVITGGVSITPTAGDANFNISGAAGSSRSIYFKTGAANRFGMRTNDTAEAGNNGGSNFELIRYDDSGASLGTVFSVARDTGILSFTAPPTVNGVQLVTTENSLTLGTTETTAAAGNHGHAAATTTVDGFMSAADKTKLNGVATQATKNDTDANLKNRANHTGTQAISTVTGLQTALDGKAAISHNHSAADINSGVFDIARIPNIPVTKLTGNYDAANLTGTIDPARLPVVMAGEINRVVAITTIANLTTSQQAEISNGTIVTTADGFRWTYLSGPKTDEESYVQMADVTPEWGVIANRPSVFPSNIANVTGLQTALDGKASSGHSHGNASAGGAGFMTAAHFTKLEGISTGATANSPDSTLTNRANHTGTQAISTVTGLQSALDDNAAAITKIQSSVNHGVIGETVGSAPQLYTNTLVGSPDTVSDLAIDDTLATVQTDPAEGKVLRLTGVARHVSTRKWFAIGQGRTHRVTARVRVVTDHATNLNRTGIGFRYTNDAGDNSGANTVYTTHAAADGWITVTQERTSDQIRAAAPTATHFRPNVFNGVITTGVTASGAVVEVAWLKYEDVTPASDTMGGYMSAADKAKLNGIAAGATALTLGTTASTAAAGNHTHPYLPLTGGTLTGNLTAPQFHLTDSQTKRFYADTNIAAIQVDNSFYTFSNGGVFNSSIVAAGTVQTTWIDGSANTTTGVGIGGAGGLTINGAGGLNVNAGSVTVTRTTADAYLEANANAGRLVGTLLKTGNTNRWGILSNNVAEGGSNSGSNFVIRRYNDAGTSLGDALTIARATGLVSAPSLEAQNLTVSTMLKSQNIQVDAAAANYRSIKFTTSGSERWGFVMENSAETGTSAGGNLWMTKGNNSGVSSNVMHFDRDSGNVTVFNNLIVQKPIFAFGLNVSTAQGDYSVVEFTKTGIGREFVMYTHPRTSSTVGGDFTLQGMDNSNTEYTVFTANRVAKTLTIAVQSYFATGKLIFGSSGTDGFTYTSGTMYLENNRNFSIGAGTFTSGQINSSTLNGSTAGVSVIGAGGLSVSGSGGITASGSGGFTATNGNILMQRTTADASIVASSNAGRTQSLSFQTDGSARWMIFSDNAAEGGSNAGSNFNIRRYSDAGSSLGNALTIVRSTGAATFGSTVTAVDFTATSDERLKTNWRQAAEKGWTLRMSKELYGEFDWTNGEGSGIGTSAQILRKEVPAGVRENEEGQLSVSYGHVAYLGVMDLAEHVDELLNEVSALKAEINLMKGEG